MAFLDNFTNLRSRPKEILGSEPTFVGSHEDTAPARKLPTSRSFERDPHRVNAVTSISPWSGLHLLGAIIQPDDKYYLYNQGSKIISIKKESLDTVERSILKKLEPFRHITSLLEVFEQNDTIYLSLQSAEITLQDAFDFIEWDEKYIQLVAKSVWCSIS